MGIVELQNTLVVELSGDMDHHFVEKYAQSIDDEMMRTGKRHLIFDFSKVAFMDSSGIGMILGRYRQITAKGGKVAIMNMDEQMKRIYTMSGLHHIIEYHENIGEGSDAVGEVNNL